METYTKEKMLLRIRTHAVLCIALLALIIGCFSALPSSAASAKTDYPVLKQEGLKATLSTKYNFKSPSYSSYKYGRGTKYACIYRKGTIKAKLKLRNGQELRCIGKYKGKFYFNLREGSTCPAVYTYKLGDKKFKRLCKNLNFEPFKKNYVTMPYYTDIAKKHAGIMNKRYVFTSPGHPTDAAGGYGMAYIYDLKKNKKVYIGKSHDLIYIGKTVYWSNISPVDKWNQSEEPKIIIKSCTLTGKDRKTIKIIPVGHLNAGYGRELLDTHYVTFSYITKDGKSGPKFKERYR